MTEPLEVTLEENKHNPEEELNESIEECRSKVGEELQQFWTFADKSCSPNVAHNFRAIRSILAINAEILDRCMGSMVDSFKNDDDGKVMARFCRKEFECVEATAELISRYGNRSSVSFASIPMISEESFLITSLCTCPSHLAIFSLEYLPKGDFETAKFIDYEALLYRSLLLHEEILEPFLHELKKHLESVQVLLGEIDAWLMEVVPIMQFIESTFDINIPKAPDTRQYRHGYKNAKYYDSILNLKKVEVNNVQGEFTFKFAVSEEDGRQSLAKFMEFTSTIAVP